MSIRILVVDDEPAMCQLVSDALVIQNLEPVTANSADQAMEIVRSQDLDVVLTDVKMPGRTGLELCGELTDLRPELPVIVMTAFGNMETAIDALRNGAFDFVTKPFEMDLLAAAVRRAINHRQLTQQVRMLREKLASETSQFGHLIGQSTPMTELFDLLARIADTHSTILIHGESGTGKELVARCLHDRSSRRDEPFVAINCAAVPESLLESEIFGHTKGAFTGADSEKPGLFQRADGGTLFLDEIGEMPLAMQAKLLRVLEDSRVRPVGGNQEIPVNTRVICATNRDLKKEVECGQFRQDLFFRLNVIPVEVPPLRIRGSDILLLAQHFLEHYSKQIDRPIKSIAPAAADRMLKYRWPGNVRELRNVVERAVALTRMNQLTLEDLPESIREFKPDKMVLSVEDPAQLLPMAEIERQYIEKVLRATGGNKTLSAKLLGFDRTTLYRKIEQFEIELTSSGSSPESD